MVQSLPIETPLGVEGVPLHLERRLLEGKVALITGGARGIGAAISQCLADAGADIALGFHHGRERAEVLSDALTRDGQGVSVHQGNVAQQDDCTRVAQEVLDRHGRIDFLVNNAGITVDKTVRKMSADDWYRVLEVNLSGTFHMTRAVLNHMIAQGRGRIVNISSVIGQTGSIGQANYAASKSGLLGFTKSLALEVANKGITVNCVAPGFIETEMVAAMPKHALDAAVARIPLGRLGNVREVARCVRFLLEDDAAYITGSVLTVNGGLEM
jgi:3-oxoacyl-(acyl-carrier-protein) reductase